MVNTNKYTRKDTDENIGEKTSRKTGKNSRKYSVLEEKEGQKT